MKHGSDVETKMTWLYYQFGSKQEHGLFSRYQFKNNDSYEQIHKKNLWFVSDICNRPTFHLNHSMKLLLHLQTHQPQGWQSNKKKRSTYI